MTAEHLSDVQWCFLDLLMRARQTGVSRINRMEILNSQFIPQGAAMKLVFSGLLMGNGPFVQMHGQHDFEITDAGVAAYNLRFGNGSNPEPTRIADAVILLPDLSARPGSGG